MPSPTHGKVGIIQKDLRFRRIFQTGIKFIDEPCDKFLIAFVGSAIVAKKVYTEIFEIFLGKMNITGNALA